ncbi:MAG: acyltransferase family protein [Gammaproteobacteria bacterium]
MLQNKAGPKKYRADIDGLRAIAVLSVIAFHIDHRLLPAGFIGVDIFFVISGFLISSHIMSEIRSNTFSIAEFYRRRIKRIAPAMFVVLGATVLAAQFLFRPEDAEKTAEAGLWSILSLANVYFWLFQDTSYFAANSNELPLLHLWSLGVEEQFYVIWPLVLMATYTATRAVGFGIVMILVAAASFLFGQYYFVTDPSFVYYMLPARAGELLVGAIAAHHVGTSKKAEVSQALVLAMALVGSVLVVASLIFVTELAPFPGFQAIPPTVGTVLLILAGYYGNTWPTRLMQFKPMVWVGLISYSAYLWHWPLLAFLNYGGFAITWKVGLTVLFLTLLLAWLTYRFVEQPLRYSKLPLVPLALRQFVLPALLIGVVIGASMKSDGYAFHRVNNNYDANMSGVREVRRPAYHYDYVCQVKTLKPSDLENPDCVVGTATDKAPGAMLWGDSIAAHHIGMLGAFAKEAGFRFNNAEVGSCPPISSSPEKVIPIDRIENCANANKLVWNQLDKYSTVIVSAMWDGYKFTGGEILPELETTLKDLVALDKHVIIIGQSPIVGDYDRLCEEKAVGFRFINCDAPPVPLRESIIKTNTTLQAMADMYETVDYFDVTRYLCPDSVCPLFFESGEPIYFDSHHMTITASWMIGQKIIEQDGVPEAFARISR